MSCKLDQSVEDNYLYMLYALPTPSPHCSQECVDVESSADVIGKTIPRMYCIGGGVNIFCNFDSVQSPSRFTWL